MPNGVIQLLRFERFTTVTYIKLSLSLQPEFVLFSIVWSEMNSVRWTNLQKILTVRIFQNFHHDSFACAISVPSDPHVFIPHPCHKLKSMYHVRSAAAFRNVHSSPASINFNNGERRRKRAAFKLKICSHRRSRSTIGQDLKCCRFSYSVFWIEFINIMQIAPIIK